MVSLECVAAQCETSAAPGTNDQSRRERRPLLRVRKLDEEFVTADIEHLVLLPFVAVVTSLNGKLNDTLVVRQARIAALL